MTSSTLKNAPTAIFLISLIALAFGQTFSKPNFIVVGGGTAGCTVAARLCAGLPTATVLLLERGAERDAETEAKVRQPRRTFETWFDTKLTENFATDPDPSIGNRSLIVVTGSTLGGSSSINSGQITLPPAHVVPSWGLHRLTPTRVIALLRRIRAKIMFAVPPSALRHTLLAQWLAAARRAGFNLTRDPYSQRMADEVYLNRLTVTNRGFRVDACTAYVAPALANACSGRLRVVQGATVQRVLFKRGCDKRRPYFPCAVGVEYIERGRPVKVEAENEVILSAGPFGSPKLLQVSGIGPKQILKKAGVQLIRNLPVGQYAQSRAVVVLTSVYTSRPVVPENNGTLLSSRQTLKQWRDGDGGPLGVAIVMVNGAVARSAELAAQDAWYGPFLDTPLIGTNCIGNRHPNSYSSVEITSANVSSPPRVKMNFFAHPDDMHYMVDCVKRIRRLHAELMQPLGATLTLPPGLTEDMLDNEVLLQNFIRASAQNAYHFVGGAAVRRVVDPWFQVRGVKNLRVVDSSVIPHIPESSGVMAVTYIIAEHASDLLMKRYSSAF